MLIEAKTMHQFDEHHKEFKGFSTSAEQHSLRSPSQFISARHFSLMP